MLRIRLITLVGCLWFIACGGRAATTDEQVSPVATREAGSKIPRADAASPTRTPPKPDGDGGDGDAGGDAEGGDGDAAGDGDRVSKEGDFCGGIGGIPCSESFVCVVPGTSPDTAGTCEKAP